MHSEFERTDVAIILRAMILQADDGEWGVLKAQHEKCAPIVRLYGTSDHLEQLGTLENRMQIYVAEGRAILAGEASA
ncbi:hypothetical protein [uncultured Agrobacterium sp.]|uniref:hypothetical protein n=1 Tax=Agrobacterium cavarae TaxID=2528239 RepID=UPI0025F15A1B|nr:hypothetical protein [uncultured Agrobacterium sp.]